MKPTEQQIDSSGNDPWSDKDKRSTTPNSTDSKELNAFDAANKIVEIFSDSFSKPNNRETAIKNLEQMAAIIEAETQKAIEAFAENLAIKIEIISALSIPGSSNDWRRERISKRQAVATIQSLLNEYKGEV